MKENQGHKNGLRENVSVENVDRLLGELRELKERWDDGFTASNPSLRKRYVEGKLEVVVATTGIGHPADFWILARVNGHIVARHNVSEPSRNNAENLDVGKSRPYRDDRVVFVGNIERMNDLEGFAPSEIWLATDHEIKNRLAGSLYSASGEGFIFPHGAVADWKRRFVGRGLPVQSHSGADHVIEGRPEVMDAIAQHHAPFDGYLGEISPEDLFGSLRICITDDQVRVGLAEPLNSHLKISKVMYGPFDLRAGSREHERIGHGQVPGE